MPAKAPSKKGGKTALLKAQESLRAEMVSTAGRTASGRQRRPTEKETYRTSLLGFSAMLTGTKTTCVPTRQALTYSVSKTPPTVLARKPTSKIHMKPQKASTNDSDSEGSSDSNDSNNYVDSMDQDDIENESDCRADNTPDDHDEHKLEDSEVLDTDMNFNKGPHQRLKASDFDQVTKDLLTSATSIYRCLVVTRAPFPETLIIETKLAKDAWREACNMAELTIQLTPSLVKMMTRRTSQVRGELKTKMRTLTALFFGFRASRSIPAIKQNRDLAESLKEGSRFVFKINPGGDESYVVRKPMLTEGIVHAKYFDPLPIQTIALILTAIECCIDEWMTGLKEDIKFSSLAYSPVYHLHLDSLQRFDERTAAYKLLGKIGVNLLDVARMHAGVDPFMAAVTIKSFTDDVFDEAIREHKDEAREAQEEGGGD
ncbi:hypothetical protein DFJ58DRAFT_917166 [Suillus subalutaceus]|uniref:uncharacterized protein n=1 Tax=Suillus subalutaceus TaxID=48586 RepID=UPI001B86281A|nr:uncharacterized protein DFJ58DRAFT_917166 [Suillus subalutaceus]KAG1838539.1 hypothetical protein DFJ58DRAFT_917166 [Suillus subalutaceus]